MCSFCGWVYFPTVVKPRQTENHLSVKFSVFETSGSTDPNTSVKVNKRRRG